MKNFKAIILGLSLSFGLVALQAEASVLKPVTAFQSAELEAWHLYSSGVYNDLVGLHPNPGVWAMASRVEIQSLTAGEETEVTVEQSAFYARAVFYPEYAQIVEFYISHMDAYVEDGEQGGLDFQVNRDIEGGLERREDYDEPGVDEMIRADQLHWQTEHRAEFLARLRVLMLQKNRFKIYLTSDASNYGCSSLRILDVKTSEISETSLCSSSPD
jgi:hypothetical protein